MILNSLEYVLLSTTKEVEKEEFYPSFYDRRDERVVIKSGASAGGYHYTIGKRIGRRKCLSDDVYFKLLLDGDRGGPIAQGNNNQLHLVIENNTGEGRAKNWRVEVAKT